MRIIKKLLIYSTIIGASVLSILVVFGFVYQDSIINSVKKELNKHLNAEIKVGKIELSFISNFPLASITLKDVVGFESKNYSYPADTLFVFSDFELSFNILEIVNGSYILNEMEATNGFINLEINTGSEENFLIFESDPKNTSSFSLNLKKVKLTNVEIGYNDFRVTDQYQIHFKNTIARGNFSETKVSTALYGDIIIRKLELEKTKYLTNEPAHIDVGLGINLETGSFQITRGFLTLREKYKFEVKGKTNEKLFHYTFDAKGLKIKNAKTLIPSKHTFVLRDYDLDGNLDVYVEVKRKAVEKRPSITGSFAASSGELVYKKTGQSVLISAINGSFDLGKLAAPQTTKISISKFALITKEAKATGEFQLYNLKSPSYKIITIGKADLLEISKLADLGENFGMKGVADFEISASGKILNADTITHNDIRSIKGNAQVTLQNGIFEINGLPEIIQVNTEIAINEKDVVLTNLSAKVAQSETSGEAKLVNWLDYALKKSKRIDISGKVKTSQFNVADWQGEKTETPTAFSLPEYLSFEGSVQIGNLINEETQFQNVRSDVAYFPKRLSLSNTYFDGFGGQVFTNSTLQEWTNGFEFKGDVITHGIDLSTVLSTYNNFGLTSITSEQLKGDLHSNFQYSFSSDRFFNINKPTINVDGDLMLLNGEIIENKLLYSIPKEIESNKVVALFVNLELFEKRLHHIKFDTLSNHITIENEVISIPRMTIKSSALNIGVQGIHSFDNEMDYYMNFDLNSVLGKKEPIKDEYGFIKDDGNGNRNMYLHVYTKNGEVEVDVDKYGSKKLINLTNSEEMGVAKSILKEEFGLFKNDTTVVVPEKEEVFEFDVDLGEFSDSTVTKADSAIVDTVKSDTGVFGKILKKKKKKKKADNFEEWDVEDEDF